MEGKAIELEQRKEYLGNIDPFDLPLEVVKSLSSDEYRTVIQTLYRKYGSWIEEQFESLHAQSLVLCDRKVVYASINRYEPKDEVVDKIETMEKKPCYIFMKELFIEELSSWSDLGGDDYYPTLDIYVGNQEWSDEKVFSLSIHNYMNLRNDNKITSSMCHSEELSDEESLSYSQRRDSSLRSE